MQETVERELASFRDETHHRIEQLRSQLDLESKKLSEQQQNHECVLAELRQSASIALEAALQTQRNELQQLMSSSTSDALMQIKEGSWRCRSC